MRIVKEFILREIAGESILVPVGDTALDFNGLIALNEAGAFLWQKLQKDVTLEELTEYMMQEYEVEEKRARADIIEFVDTLSQSGIAI